MAGEQAKEPQDDDRLSLAPLDAETALRALLAVDPNDNESDNDGAQGIGSENS